MKQLNDIGQVIDLVFRISNYRLIEIIKVNNLQDLDASLARGIIDNLIKQNVPENLKINGLITALYLEIVKGVQNGTFILPKTKDKSR